MSVRPETKHQAFGVLWGVLASILTAALIGGFLLFNDANRWDDEPEERVQMEALKELKADVEAEKKRGLRSDKRIITRDLSKVAPEEEAYRMLLMEQLSEVETEMRTLSEEQ